MVVLRFADGIVDGILGTGFQGSLRENTARLIHVRLDPSKIEIAGASNILENLSSVDTEKISLGNETKPFHKEVKLELPEGITVTNKSVNVTIDIVEKK